jgi:hypothetical protein
MDGSVRCALLAGLGLALCYLAARTFRHRGPHWPATDFVEAIVLVVAPFPIPGAIEMVRKGLGSEELPIFNSGEDRAALVIGGAGLVVALAYAVIVTMMKGFRAAPAAIEGQVPDRRRDMATLPPSRDDRAGNAESSEDPCVGSQAGLMATP